MRERRLDSKSAATIWVLLIMLLIMGDQFGIPIHSSLVRQVDLQALWPGCLSLLMSLRVEKAHNCVDLESWFSDLVWLSGWADLADYVELRQRHWACALWADHRHVTDSLRATGRNWHRRRWHRRALHERRDIQDPHSGPTFRAI